MAVLFAIVFVLLAVQTKGENFASCSRTLCGEGKVCRIIERCRSISDCTVGTICLAPENLPAQMSSYQCQFDDPLLRLVEGSPLEELQCSIANPCPVGTSCAVIPGVCCTGETKDTGTCPIPQKDYFLSKGSCKTFCRHDQECPGFQRCCDTGIGCNTCMDTVPISTCETHSCVPGFHCVMAENDCLTYPCQASPKCIQDKPGTCPVPDKTAACVDQCEVDSHCQGDEKCCGVGKCNVCISPALITSTPAPTSSPLSFNDGFSGLTGTTSSSGADLGTGTSPLPPVTGSAFSGMSSFLGSNSPAGGDGNGSTSVQTSTTTMPGMSSTGVTGNPMLNRMMTMMQRLRNGASTSSSSTGSPIMSLPTMLNNVRKLMDTMKNNQNSMTGMTGFTGMNGMTGMNSMNTLGGGVNPFSSMPSNMNSKTTNPLESSKPPLALNPMNTLSSPSSNNSPMSSLNDLSSLGSGGNGGLGGGSSLDPVFSGNALQNLGGGRMTIGGGNGGGLSPPGLNPMMPSLGGERNLESGNTGVQRRRSGFKCDMMCMFMFMMNN